MTTERKFLCCILALNSNENKIQYLSELGLKHFAEPACIELFQAICKDVISNDSRNYIDFLNHLHGNELNNIAALLNECYSNWIPETEAIEILPGLIEELKINSLQRMLEAD